jgi:SAM-dependent methyltransferase
LLSGTIHAKVNATDEYYNKLVRDGPERAFNSHLDDHDTGDRALFIGVGEGRHAAELAGGRRGPEVVGIELSAKRIKQTYAAHGANAHFARADAELLPFVDESFDCVVAHAVLHHLPAWQTDGLDEIQRALRPGGSFVFYEPGRYNPPAVVRRRFFPSNIHTPGEKPFDPKQLRRELEGRFSSVEMTGHCLFSHVIPVVDEHVPFTVPYRLTESLYRGERRLFDLTSPRFAWILTGRAEL